MSLFDDASLVTTPNAYKVSKLYSIKPTSGLGDMTVVRATSATRVNSAGLIESVAINVPRLDYPPLGGCPSILVEPLRTNLALYSEQFDNASWSKINTTVTANTTTSPSGTLTADKLIATLTNDQHRVDQTPTSSAGVQTFSVYAKASGYNFVGLRIGLAGSMFNLTNGATSLTTVGYTALTENVGNGWYRCILTKTLGLINDVCRINISDGTAVAPNFVGNNVDGIFLWGAQLEAGANATSYIPTVAATVTRNADVISKTGISSLIGQTEGTLFVDVNYKAQSITKAYLNLGTSTSSYIAIGVRTNNKIGMEVLNSGVQVNVASTNTYSTNQRLKIAMTYKANDFKLYVNGISQATDTSGTVPAKAEVYLGSYGNGTSQSMDGINSAVLFTTALTNAQLATLTTI